MLIERDGQPDVVKILDFGIAKVTEPRVGARGAHPGGRHLRHARVPVARAGARGAGRRARRHLRGRRDPLRDAHRPAAVRVRRQGEDHLHAPRARAPARSRPERHPWTWRCRSSRPSCRPSKSRASTGSPALPPSCRRSRMRRRRLPRAWRWNGHARCPRSSSAPAGAGEVVPRRAGGAAPGSGSRPLGDARGRRGARETGDAPPRGAGCFAPDARAPSAGARRSLQEGGSLARVGRHRRAARRILEQAAGGTAE